ncbi:MAG TPA: tetratricopeptide repeat protein [Methanospirillum sp.]|nr:tetratricopeptide repeat protein [Methanospirillum sp.]
MIHRHLTQLLLQILVISLITALMISPALAGCGPSKGLFSGSQLTSTLVSPTGTLSETPQYAQNVTSVKTGQNDDDWVAIGNSQVQSGSYQEAITAYDKAIESDSKNAAAWNGKMSALLFQDKYTEVMELFSDAEKVIPNNPGIWINKGRAEYYAGNMSDAIQSADTALRLEKDNIDAMVLKANGLVDSGKNEEAQALTDRVLELDPQNQEIWYVQGTIQFLNKEYAKAIESMEKDLKQNPDRICSYFYLSMSHKEISGSEAVIEVLDRMTKHFPTDNRYANAEVGDLLIQLVKKTPGTYLHDTVPLWEWYFSYNDQGDEAYYQQYLGDRWSTVKFALEDYILGRKGSFDDIETIIKPLQKKAEPLTNPETDVIIDIYHEFANVAWRSGRYFESVKSADNFINLTSEENRLYPNVFWIRVMDLNNLGRYEEVLEAANTAVVLNTSDTFAWDTKGQALENLERYEEAQEAYEQEILQDQDSASGWYGTGRALFKLKKYEAALLALNKAIELGYNSASETRDEVLKELGREVPKDPDQKSENSGETLNETPSSSDALDDAINKAEENKDWKTMFNLTEEGVALFPQEFRYWRRQADALIELGRSDEALNAYDKSIEVARLAGPTAIEISLAVKGDTLFRLGRYEEAIEIYTQAREQANNVNFYDSINYAITESPEKILENNPDDFETLGYYYYATDQFEEAYKAFNQAIETGFYLYESSVWFALARTLDKLDRPAEQKEAYKRASNCSVSEYLIYGTASYTDDPQLKEAAFTYATTLNPESPYVLSYYADYLTELGRYDEALKAYDKAIEFQKDTESIQYLQDDKAKVLEESQSGSRATNQTS